MRVAESEMCAAALEPLAVVLQPVTSAIQPGATFPQLAPLTRVSIVFQPASPPLPPFPLPFHPLTPVLQTLSTALQASSVVPGADAGLPTLPTECAIAVDDARSGKRVERGGLRSERGRLREGAGGQYRQQASCDHHRLLRQSPR